MMKPVRKGLVRALGFERYIRFVSQVYLRLVGAGWGKARYPELFFLRKIIRPGFVCLDIGANLGYYSVALSRLAGPTGRVLAVEVATLNRVVGIFEREMAVRFVLVANNNQLIFLSGTGPQPVPALTDGDKFALMDQNQDNADRVIGNANYDIGHVLCTSGGGVASVGVVCYDGSKARGVSADDVKTIYHEMGRQLGANHSFNTDSPNRRGGTAWEPGSGSTFMSYSGIFGPADDVQGRCDDVFHTGSYEEMQALMSNRGCGTSTATGNLAPVVTAPASGKTLPFGTPFKLTATTTDADNDPLTYSWEELDLGPTGNLTMPQVADETPPLFRS